MAHINPKFAKTLIYRCFKETFEFEKYLEILDSKYLLDFFKFRTSNHKLPIECGRWQNIERNRRLCKLCQKHEIGDEFSYIMECPFFKRKRQLLIKQVGHTVNSQWFLEQVEIVNIKHYIKHSSP